MVNSDFTKWCLIHIQFSFPGAPASHSCGKVSSYLDCQINTLEVTIRIRNELLLSTSLMPGNIFGFYKLQKYLLPPVS